MVLRCGVLFEDLDVGVGRVGCRCMSSYFCSQCVNESPIANMQKMGFLCSF